MPEAEGTAAPSPQIVACLAYYAEQVATLERCVRSLVGVCDMVVALEGRFDPYPEVDTDPSVQQAAIEAACADTGLGCYHRHGGPWGDQVAMRTELMQLGARWESSWLLVIDADEWVTASDPGALRRALAATQLDVARVHLRRYPLQGCSPGRALRRLYRASTGVRLRTAHNGYITADGRWLNGDPAYVPLEPEEDFAALLQLGHDLEARKGDRERAQARKDALQVRRRMRLESWQPEWQARRAACATR